MGRESGAFVLLQRAALGVLPASEGTASVGANNGPVTQPKSTCLSVQQLGDNIATFRIAHAISHPAAGPAEEPIPPRSPVQLVNRPIVADGRTTEQVGAILAVWQSAHQMLDTILEGSDRVIRSRPLALHGEEGYEILVKVGGIADQQIIAGAGPECIGSQAAEEQVAASTRREAVAPIAARQDIAGHAA